MVRVKHRYLVAQILYPEPTSSVPESLSTTPLVFRRPTPADITSSQLIRLIREKISEIFGGYGVGSCAGSLALKYFSGTTSTLIIRCPREKVRLIWTALTLINHLPAVDQGRYRAGALGVPCVFRVVHNSGTIRKSEQKIIEMARKEILLAKAAGEVLADDLMLAFGRTKDRAEDVAGSKVGIAVQTSDEYASDDSDGESKLD